MAIKMVYFHIREGKLMVDIPKKNDIILSSGKFTTKEIEKASKLLLPLYLLGYPFMHSSTVDFPEEAGAKFDYEKLDNFLRKIFFTMKEKENRDYCNN